jgi:hypothetical protein
MINAKRKLKDALQKQRSLQEAFGACQAKLAAKGIHVDSADQLPEVIDALIEMAETGSSSMLEGEGDGNDRLVTSEEDDLGFTDGGTTAPGSVQVPRPVIGRDTVPRAAEAAPAQTHAAPAAMSDDPDEPMDPSSIAAKFAKRNADMLSRANKGEIKQGGKPGARLGSALGSMPSAPKMNLDAQRAALQRIGVNAQAQPIGGIKQ